MVVEMVVLIVPTVPVPVPPPAVPFPAGYGTLDGAPLGIGGAPELEPKGPPEECGKAEGSPPLGLRWEW